jgi:hypothetical protein
MKNKNCAVIYIKVCGVNVDGGPSFDKITKLEPRNDNSWALSYTRYISVKRGAGYYMTDDFDVESSTITIGRHKDDYIVYNGKTYTRNDFPKLAVMVHNQNINTALGVLE